MSAPISIVIPTLNSACSLPATLLSLMEGLDAGLICEVVVTDGGSNDATRVIAEAWGAEVIAGATSRGGQLRRGVAASRGEWVMVLHSDTILQDGWAREVQKRMHEGPLCFSLAFRAPGIAAKLVAAWANLRTDVLRLPYGDQGLLLRHKDYDAAGGYLDQPLMEDVALVCALAQRVRRIRAHAFTGAKKYQQQGWMRRGAKNLILLMRYLAGAKPEDLVRAYQPSEPPN